VRSLVVLAASLALLFLQVALAEVLPAVRLDYVEVLELHQGGWSSRYLQVSGNTLWLRSSAEILVVRMDPSSGLTPVDVLVDGSRPVLAEGAGFLWGALVLRLDGKPHDLVIRLNASRSLEASSLLLGVPRGPVEPGMNLTVPEVPGLQPAGFTFTCLVSDPKSLWDAVGAFFVMNATEVTLLGERLYAASVIVPRSTLRVGRGFLKCSYGYLYFAPLAYAQLVPLSASPLLYVNHPGYNGSARSSLIAGRPPHLALLTDLRDADVASYNVRVAVLQKEEPCLGRVSFRVLPPPGATQVGESIALGSNTTIVLRFYREGVAAADVVVTTPPPTLVVEPPFHSLSIEVLDRAGEKLPEGTALLLQEGRPAASARVVNGTALFCGLTPGDYVLMVYRWGSLVARRPLRIPAGESSVTANATSFEVRFFRQGLGELLRNFTLVVRRGGVAEKFAGGDHALVRGVPPGNYTFEVWAEGRLLAVFNFTVSLDTGSQTFTLPVYYLRVKVLDALDRPLEGVTVALSGAGLAVNRSTGPGGVVNIGILPSGEYNLIVFIGGVEFKERVSLQGDSVRTVRTEVLAVVGGRAILLRHVLLAALVVLVVVLALALLSIIRRLARRGGGVVEV
jgi:hypothetical protein